MLDTIFWVGFRLIVFVGAVVCAMFFCAACLMFAMVGMRRYADWKYKKDKAREDEDGALW